MRLSSRHLLTFLLMLVLLPLRGGWGDAMAMAPAGMAAHAPVAQVQVPTPQDVSATAQDGSTAARDHGCCDQASAADGASGCAACQACQGLGPRLDAPASAVEAAPGVRPAAEPTGYRSAVAARAIKPPIG